MKMQEIQDLVKLVSRLGVTELEIEQKEFKINIKTEGKRKGKIIEHETTVIQTPVPMGIPQMPVQTMPMQVVPAQAPVPSNQAVEELVEESKYVSVKSPMIGTFYRASAPDKDAFVNVGDAIKPGKVICIVEAMKLFNEIEAEISGTIIKVLIDDATPVEYDQPLFLVDPS